MSHYTGAHADEIFVGNVRTEEGVPDYLSCLQTVRIGEQALDIEGNKLPPDEHRPMFVGRCEADAYDRIMMRRTYPHSTRQW